MICCDSSTLGFMHVTAGSSLFRDNATGVMNSKNRNIAVMVTKISCEILTLFHGTMVRNFYLVVHMSIIITIRIGNLFINP